MCVWSFGWNDDVMATPRVKSTSRRNVRAPSIASEFVRVNSPSLADRLERCPSSRIRWRSFWVPIAPAAKMTSLATKARRRFRTQAPERSVEIS